jgi:uncharacterized protein YhbP (UPF0306 family)
VSPEEAMIHYQTMALYWNIIMWFSIVALVGCVAAAIYLGIQYRDSCKRIKQMEEARKIYAKRYGLSKSDE